MLDNLLITTIFVKYYAHYFNIQLVIDSGKIECVYYYVHANIIFFKDKLIIEVLVNFTNSSQYYEICNIMIFIYLSNDHSNEGLY